MTDHNPLLTAVTTAVLAAMECQGNLFGDYNADEFAADMIEQLTRDGIRLTRQPEQDYNQPSLDYYVDSK